MIRPDINDDSLHEWVEWTLETKGIHPMLEALCRRYLELKEKDFKRNWPVTLHEQYLVVLDERDELQKKIDKQERLLAIYGAMAEDMPTDDLFEMYEEEYDMQFGVEDD